MGVDGNVQNLTRHNQVRVLDVVDLGDVADAGVVLLGDGRESVAGDDGVVGRRGRAADVLAYYNKHD